MKSINQSIDRPFVSRRLHQKKRDNEIEAFHRKLAGFMVLRLPLGYLERCTVEDGCVRLVMESKNKKKERKKNENFDIF